MGVLELCCCFPKDEGYFFVVSATSNQKVGHLLKVVCEDLKAAGHGMLLKDIQLYKADISTTPKEDILQRTREWLHVQPAQARLQAFEELEELLPDDPPKGKLHLVIANTEATLKRSASPLLQHDLLKRTKLAQDAPSQVARSSTYKSIQHNPSEKILDDRPSPDADIAPIALLYHGFGHFEDIIACRKATDIERFKPAVDNFAETMSRFYRHEDERRDAGLPLLNIILAIRGDSATPSLSAAAIGSVRSNGHSVGRHDGPITVVEFKNELTGIIALPHVEAVAYVAHLHARIDGRRQLFQKWRIPCLGITVIGHEVRFYAIVLLGHQYRVVSLTPALSCLQSASSGKEREALYRAFAAASELQAHIVADVELRLNTPSSPITNGTYRLPAISKLCSYGSPNGYIEFEIVQYHPSRQSYRQLYLAQARSGGDVKNLILVKFSRTYCIELHDYCFKNGHAPRILGFEHLPGGWYGIAMEYLSEASPIQSAQLEPQLTELVNGFHDKGLVHGDLRDVNILSAGDHQFWLIDFDWGGKDGEVEYPTSNLNLELTIGRTCDDWKIRREDDIRILRNTLDKLKS
ncbi:hypothetical protein H1R20_g1589, partial [Candolleomyces eurysporus]